MGTTFYPEPFKKPKRKNRVRSKITKARRAMVKELDAHARQEVFERDGFKCVRCGDLRIQWAHIFTRVHKCLRWESDNALSLCGGCHIWWHKYPILASEWFRKNWPERYERVVAVYQLNPKVNVRERWAELAGEGNK